ncbi:MAG: hypothetical protein ACYTGH_21010 [Planctomycetota bacterium]|jgi:hypothetical protein
MMRNLVRGVLLAACMVLPMVSGCDCGKAKEDVSEGVDKMADEVTGTRAIKQGEKLKGQIQGIQQDQQDKLKEALGEE